MYTASGQQTYASRRQCEQLESAQRGRWIDGLTFQLFASDPCRNDGTGVEFKGEHSGDERLINLRLPDGQVYARIAVKAIMFGAPEFRVLQATRGEIKSAAEI